MNPASHDTPSSGPPEPGRSDDPGAAVPPDPGWARALVLGALWSVLVVALLLLAQAGAGFIYQGF